DDLRRNRGDGPLAVVAHVDLEGDTIADRHGRTGVQPAAGTGGRGARDHDHERHTPGHPALVADARATRHRCACATLGTWAKGDVSREEDPVEDIAFDDIARLKSKISDAFGGWSDPVEVTQDMINRFAELTGDHQWIHVDVERAKRESPFGGTI